MPLPKPKSGQSKDDFIKKCMSSDAMNDEFPDQDQRAAVCYDAWREKESYEKLKLLEKHIKEI